MQGECLKCHNGFSAPGKPLVHPVTSASCDSCHKVPTGALSSSSWLPVMTYNHAGVVTGTCATCHNGAQATGKPTTHIPTSASCDVCHSTVNWALASPHFIDNPPPTAGVCSSCHNNTNARGKIAGVHIPTSLQCDTCHTSFVSFQKRTMNHDGLAGRCITCHSGGFISQNAQTKPKTHVSTTAQCDTCHSSTTTWATGTLDHATVLPPVTGRCSTCHNSVSALGKPVTHVPTGAQCDSCHTNFTAFKPAVMNHVGAAGQCATCHSGSYLAVNALAKSAIHIPTGARSCDVCHASTTAWKPASYNHAGAAGICATCHDGRSAMGKSATHLPTTGSCDACHTNYVAFAPATMNHTGLSGACATCHSGSYLSINAQVKTATHVSTVAQCDTCHRSTTSWATVTYLHAAGDTACNTCHGVTPPALSKPSTHIPTGAQCSTCHKNYTAFAPAIMDHANTNTPLAAGNCATCHDGTYTFANAQGKTATHVPTTQSCDTCHSSTTTWTGATYVHTASAPGMCSTCHTGTMARGKPATHIPTSGQCDLCHSNYVAFKPTGMTHAATTAPCSTCHNGSYTTAGPAGAQAKPATHITTSGQCDTCHTNTIAFKPASMNHTGVAGQCSTCHDGIKALGKPVGTGHIPTAAQCDTCHLNGFISFRPGTMNHAGTAGSCSTCHSGGTYVSFNAQNQTPGKHIVTASQCDTCHNSTTTWATGTFNHATAVPVVAGRCDGALCHGGANPNILSKPPIPTHIPTTAQCDTCHKTFVAFAPASMRHTGTTGPVATGNCSTCHGGTYVSVNAQAKTATHIGTTAQCDTCHNNTTAWKPAYYNHVGVVAGTCATCHNGTNALGKSATHLPTTASCDACHTIATAFAPTRMNHVNATGPLAAGNCSTCHSGTYLSINAQVKSATHVPTTKQCDTCHTSTSTWATATFTHAVTDVNCSTCHNGATALGKPTIHIPTGAQCSACHKNYISFRPAAMSHPATTGPVATGNCSTCHNGSYVAVNALTKPATHIPVTGQCDTCHTGYVAWAPANMNHTGQTSCTTCHGGAYVAQNAQKKTLTHIATTAQCSTCHNSTTTWATGTFNHATASPPATGICSTCHNGTNALGKPASIHIRTTAQCDVCHKNFTAFAPALMSHTGTTGPVAAANCATCHNGSYTAVNAQAKPATHILTSQTCDYCHMTTAWKPTSFAHTGITAGPCTTCHNGISAVAKPAVHIPTTASCEACHRIGMSWLPLITPYSHAGIAMGGGTCATCHIASYPNIEAKPASHLPTTAGCDVCHNSYVAWLPVKHPYSHSGVVANQCATCHGGAYTGITARPSNHIPTTLAGLPGTECSNCHSPTQFISFGSGQKMNHGSINASCATCHDSSAAYLGSMQKINRASHHSAGSKDCSTSNCHKPLGKYGTPYTKWN